MALLKKENNGVVQVVNSVKSKKEPKKPTILDEDSYVEVGVWQFVCDSNLNK